MGSNFTTQMEKIPQELTDRENCDYQKYFSYF